MKKTIVILSVNLVFVFNSGTFAQKSNGIPEHNEVAKHLYIDVHELEPGKVSFEDVYAAHQKDLSTEGKYGVDFKRFWVDEKEGLVYCLSAASDSADVKKTHAEAHGLVPAHVYEVNDGQAAKMLEGKNLYMDIHYLGAGSVTAEDVAAAHVKDLATQEKHGVNFINYWVDVKSGTVMCLSQAANESDVIATHKEAHGLIPEKVLVVKQGE